VPTVLRPGVAETAYYTAYNALINHHLDNSTLPCSQQHKQNAHTTKKVRYNKEVK